MQQNIDADVVNKWLATGFLRGVKQNQLEQAAKRLEAALQLTRGSHNREPIDRELATLTREGFFKQ